jgi:hypothetical protein
MVVYSYGKSQEADLRLGGTEDSDGMRVHQGSGRWRRVWRAGVPGAGGRVLDGGEAEF